MRRQLPFIMAFLSVFSITSLALPSLTNECGRKRINLNLPSTSDIVVYNKECDTAFIGPPSAGSAHIVAIAPTTNLRFCPSVKTLPSAINRLSQTIISLMNKLAEATEESVALEKDINQRRAILIEYEEKVKSLEDILLKHEEHSEKLIDETRNARERWEKCKKLNGETDQCLNLEHDFNRLKEQLLDYDDKVIIPLKDEIFDITKKARTLRRQIQQLVNDISENSDILDGFKKRLYSIRNDAIAEYGIFGSLEGVTAQILFESNWAKQIEYAKMLNNNRRRLHIEALPITKSILHVDVQLPASKQVNIPSSLLYASVPGFSSSGTIGSALPTGDTRIENLNANTEPINSLISGISGKLVLSLIGSCDLTNDNNELKQNVSMNELTAHISINTVNEYPMVNERNHRVRFRASKFAEEIEKRTENGGFFHTSAVHEIVNNHFSQDDFKIEFEADSINDAYTDEEKRLLTLEAKKEIVDRVLREIGTVAELKERRPPLPGMLHQSGAAMIYAQAPCFGWEFCEVAKFVIGVADSIFGEREAVAKFKSNNNVLVSHNYSSRKPANYSFTTTFKAAE